MPGPATQSAQQHDVDEAGDDDEADGQETESAEDSCAAVAGDRKDEQKQVADQNEEYHERHERDDAGESADRDTVATRPTLKVPTDCTAENRCERSYRCRKDSDECADESVRECISFTPGWYDDSSGQMSLGTREPSVCVVTVSYAHSADGTAIAYDRHGDGPPLMCLHGSGVTRDIWFGLAGALADEATLFAVDRRGRGDSGDADEWSFERELDDVEALLAEPDERPVTLFGSSFGGLLALRASERFDVDRLVLYEPPLPAVTVDAPDRTSLPARMAARLETGDREEAVRLFFTEATGAEHIEHWPIWPECVDLAETIVREGYVVESFDPTDLDVSVPTLLLTGERSPTYLSDGIDVLAEAIPDTRTVEIEGAGHAGVVTEVTQVATAVSTFLEETDT